MDRRDLARLAASPLFAGIDVVELEGLLAPESLALRGFRKGNVLLLAGCAYETLWILLEGSVAAEMHSPSGKAVRIETIAAPEAIATAMLFSPEAILPVTVEALEETRAALLPKETVIRLCQRSRPFLENYLRDSGSRIAAFSERFRLLQFSTLRERLADWLLRQAARAGGGLVTLPSSKEKLAETFGVTRPSLSREILAMDAEGLIRADGREIRILDAARLEGLIGQGRD